MIVTHCPLETLPGAVFQAIRFADAMEEKMGLPVAGGLLDQSDSLLSAAEFIRAEKARIENDLRERFTRK